MWTMTPKTGRLQLEMIAVVGAAGHQHLRCCYTHILGLSHCQISVSIQLSICISILLDTQMFFTEGPEQFRMIFL